MVFAKSSTHPTSLARRRSQLRLRRSFDKGDDGATVRFGGGVKIAQAPELRHQPVFFRLAPAEGIAGHRPSTVCI
jgi:hypothetical protein